MNKLRITMGATALAVAAVAIVACNKEKTAQQEIPCAQQTTEPQDYTLAEMIEAMSWEEGKAFFENQPIKDYTELSRKVMDSYGMEKTTQGSSKYEISWYWPTSNGDCNSDFHGLCSATKKDTTYLMTNAMGCFEDGKLVIIPTSDEDGFTADGYLAIGQPIAVGNDSIVIKEGVYVAYYDETLGR